jgi:hypothetical protein
MCGNGSKQHPLRGLSRKMRIVDGLDAHVERDICSRYSVARSHGVSVPK